MASAIFKTTQNVISQTTHLHFSPQNSKSIKKQSIPTDVVKLCSENRLKEAVGNLDFIPKEGLSTEKTQIYDCLLRSLASARDLIVARKVYDHMVGSNLHRNVYFGTRIVHIFVECGSLVDGMDAFEGTSILDRSFTKQRIWIHPLITCQKSVLPKHRSQRKRALDTVYIQPCTSAVLDNNAIQSYTRIQTGP